MIRVPDGLRAKYDVWLEGHAVPVGEHEAYRKWPAYLSAVRPVIPRALAEGGME